MSTNKDERRARKREIYCTLSIQGAGWIDSPPRPISKCDEVQVLPPKFYIPETGDRVVDIYTYPNPLLVGNDLLTLTCSGVVGDIGEQITIGPATYVSPISWAIVGELEPWQLRHLNTLDNTEASAFLATNADSIPALVTYFKFSNVQAQALSTEYLVIKDEIEAFTSKQAGSRLSCYFLNEEVTVECESDTLTLEDHCLGTVVFARQGTSITIPAGEFRSYLSQEEADSLARISAENQLDCTYVNVNPLLVDCCDPFTDSPQAAYEFELIHPNPTVLYPTGTLSGDSVEELAAALDSARKFVLGCRCQVNTSTIVASYDSNGRPKYSKLGIIVADTCEEVQRIIDITVDGTDPCSEPVTCSCPPDAVPETLTLGSCWVRDDTAELATANAYNECLDTILCTWCNDELYGVCDDSEMVVLVQGHVFAGEVCTEEGKEEANAQAQEIANSRTTCILPEDPDEETPDDQPGTQTSPYGVEAAPTDACCVVTIETESVDSKFYDIPGNEVAIVDNDLAEEMEKCAPDAKYIYLEAPLYWNQVFPPEKMWDCTSYSIKAYSTPQLLWEKDPPGPPTPYYPESICRRLIAEVQGEEDDCTDLRILQSVTTAQQLAQAYNTDVDTPYQGPRGMAYPVITDRDTINAPLAKGFPFQLTAVSDGSGGWNAGIWPGRLVANVQIVMFKTFTISGIQVNGLVGQDPIQQLNVVSPSNTLSENKPESLGWSGNVYARWDCDEDGAVTDFELVDTEPSGDEISNLDVDLHRETTSGTYYVLVGSVDSGSGEVTQEIHGDINWAITICRGDSTSESASSSDSSSSSSSSSSGSSGSSTSVASSSGSGKDTAIVPVSFYSTGYAALFVMEAPDVRFEDVMIVKGEPISRVPIDPRFVEVCEPGSIQVVSACPSTPAIVGSRIIGNTVVTTVNQVGDYLPGKVVVKISGIRKGFRGLRFPARTEKQFQANERFIKDRTGKK